MEWLTIHGICQHGKRWCFSWIICPIWNVCEMLMRPFPLMAIRICSWLFANTYELLLLHITTDDSSSLLLHGGVGARLQYPLAYGSCWCVTHEKNWHFSSPAARGACQRQPDCMVQTISCHLDTPQTILWLLPPPASSLWVMWCLRCTLTQILQLMPRCPPCPDPSTIYPLAEEPPPCCQIHVSHIAGLFFETWIPIVDLRCANVAGINNYYVLHVNTHLYLG